MIYGCTDRNPVGIIVFCMVEDTISNGTISKVELHGRTDFIGCDMMIVIERYFYVSGLF